MFALKSNTIKRAKTTRNDIHIIFFMTPSNEKTSKICHWLQRKISVRKTPNFLGLEWSERSIGFIIHFYIFFFSNIFLGSYKGSIVTLSHFRYRKFHMDGTLNRFFSLFSIIFPNLKNAVKKLIKNGKYTVNEIFYEDGFSWLVLSYNFKIKINFDRDLKFSPICTLLLYRPEKFHSEIYLRAKCKTLIVSTYFMFWNFFFL